MSDRIELSAGNARAGIALRGAEWVDWRVGADALLWTPDAAFWDETAPLLFPVCGWTRDGRASVNGVVYPLGLHGFARAQTFELQQRGGDFVTMTLRDNAATRAQYPFAFELNLEYRLTPFAFEARARVVNAGRVPMPYAFGLHPGFRWPFAGGDIEDYAIVFDEEERADVPVIAPGGLFSDQRRPVALEGRELALSSDTFAREALCFLDARSRGLRFTGPGGRALRVEADGFPHIALWSRPGAPFLCIEHWTGYGDPVDFAGELADKPSMISLAPGEERTHAARYTLEGG